VLIDGTVAAVDPEARVAYAWTVATLSTYDLAHLLP
jgi:hypothetical protein